MFLAHFSKWDYSTLMLSPVSKINFWAGEAYKLYNKMNPKNEDE